MYICTYNHIDYVIQSKKGSAEVRGDGNRTRNSAATFRKPNAYLTWRFATVLRIVLTERMNYYPYVVSAVITIRV